MSEYLEIEMSKPGYPQTVKIGNYTITLVHFLNIAEAVLTNSDLEPDDPRLEFVERIKKMKIVDGAIPGGKRLSAYH